MLAWPLAELPYGFSEDWAGLGGWLEVEGSLQRWDGWRLVVTAGSVAVLRLLHPSGGVLSAAHLYDQQGSLLVEEVDRATGRATTFHLSRTTGVTGELRARLERGEISPAVVRVASREETVFRLAVPPGPGHYKLEMLAARVPSARRKVTLRLVATILLDVRLRPASTCSLATPADSLQQSPLFFSLSNLFSNKLFPKEQQKHNNALWAGNI